jgi:hypothetical protein
LSSLRWCSRHSEVQQHLTNQHPTFQNHHPHLTTLVVKALLGYPDYPHPRRVRSLLC